MNVSIRNGALLGIAMALFTGGVAAAKPGVVASIDLAQPFGTPMPWRFTASQGPDMPDPVGVTDENAPGAIRLCLSNDYGRTCQPALQHMLAVSSAQDDLYAEPHYLNSAEVVRTREGKPLLLVSAASLHSANGDQRVALVALAYDRTRNGFVPVYEKSTGRNNNQEIRFIAGGPLKGGIISAEPTSNAPFGFWITVNRFGPASAYRQVLRYRSATRYGDGNPLAVIDSEMPNIHQQLGLLKPGGKLPVPQAKCLNPRLIRKELWC